jgi:hypothetical protein
MKCPKCKSTELTAAKKGGIRYDFFKKEGWVYSGCYADSDIAEITCESCGHEWRERINA